MDCILATAGESLFNDNLKESVEQKVEDDQIRISEYEEQKEISTEFLKEKFSHYNEKCKNVKKLKEDANFLIWNKKIPDTELEKFKLFIEEKYDLKFESYWDLHSWSVTNFPSYWEEVWNYFGLVASQPHEEVFKKIGPGFLDNDWFTGAELNYAENILRIRDNREALLCLDEEGNFEKVTFAELFQQVKLYAAAFRKHGLQREDRVACYMSHRKETIFAFLAATSIGAIWGGPQPYFGAKAASNIVSKLEPKFLIAVDRFLDYGDEYNILENLPTIAQSSPTLEKIIIVPTKDETLSKDISHIPNSCFLHHFLESGKTEGGEVPDLIFEQLPFNHPISISFTSGTTGLPKGPVHSAGSLIGSIANLSLHWNLKCGDVAHSLYPMGWSVWNYYVTCLSLGVKLFLHSGSPYKMRDGSNLWDVISKYKISFCFLITSIVDKLEKMKALPKKSNSNFDHLKAIALGGSSVKIQNYKYIQSIVKENVLITNLYGATETLLPFSGNDYNLPVYASEVQVPSLGVDYKCVDSNGNSIIGHPGKFVITVPFPALPLCIWKDENNEILNKNYLSQYRGAWFQHDVCHINPQTNGLVLEGRSDDVLIQNGERFGSADIYFAIHDIEEIQDYICVGQNKSNGDNRAILFIKMKEGYKFTPEFREKIMQKIDDELWTDCVPEVILEVPDIPYNVNNKRMESIIRRIVETNQIPAETNVRNPECLKYYCDIPEIFEQR
ncbi:acetoacetyl-CoA synthetase [Caerostris darwini]|uniref:Acetoacetyl-CoA synthetase n=1 Tax=Caerostris darwini TaxID=1538125 RepID=A0AAV4UZA3_9ARAC|nr:acetoacetyl-CoA synthetase [Caerostris darwini]